MSLSIINKVVQEKRDVWQFICDRCHTLQLRDLEPKRNEASVPTTWATVKSNERTLHFCFDCTLQWEKFKRGDSMLSVIVRRRDNDQMKQDKDAQNVIDTHYDPLLKQSSISIPPPPDMAKEWWKTYCDPLKYPPLSSY